MPEAAAASNTTPEIKLSDAFTLQMYRAEQAARLHNTPHCPIQADERVIVDGEFYAVEWASRDGLSKTMHLDARVTNLSTGRSVAYELIRSRKVLKRGTVYRYSLSGKGSWTNRTEASAGLAELAVRHTGALVFHNPVTGPVFVGVSA